MRRIIPLFAALFLACSAAADTNSNYMVFADFTNQWNGSVYCTNAVLTLGAPDYVTDEGMTFAGRPVGGDLLILTNAHYLVGYSDEYACPLWVAYKLTKAKEEWPRPEMGFLTDTRTESKVTESDYDGSGYDRGHMAPSKGMGASHGDNAQLQTFMMSNVVPQKPDLNRKVWRRLEEKALEWADEKEELWVVTGPVFVPSVTNLFNGIRVPDGCYKIFVDMEYGGLDARAFLIPQNPRNDATLGLYLVSIDEIERQTGLDFFSELPDWLEDRIERGTW